MFLSKCTRLLTLETGHRHQKAVNVSQLLLRPNAFPNLLLLCCKLFTNLMARPALWCDLRPSLSRPKSLVTLEGCHIQGLILFSQPPLSSFQGSKKKKKKKKSLGVMIQQLSLAGAVLQGHHDDNLSLEVHILGFFFFQSKLSMYVCSRLWKREKSEQQLQASVSVLQFPRPDRTLDQGLESLCFHLKIIIYSVCLRLALSRLQYSSLYVHSSS